MNNTICQCEHLAHFDKLWLTPNGNPGHQWNTRFNSKILVPKKTPYGTFKVCPDCAKDCFNSEVMNGELK